MKPELFRYQLFKAFQPRKLNPEPLNLIKSKSSGFTLLEVIISLIVASILGAILLEFMSQTVHKSFEPVRMAQGSMNLTSVVECITANYRKHMLASLQTDASTNPLDHFKNDVENNRLNCGDYNATAAWVVFNSSGEPNQYRESADASGDERVLKITVVQGRHEVTTLYTR
jgi:prepilin-type N-terminal cleavage/methylation domain-containing protein